MIRSGYLPIAICMAILLTACTTTSTTRFYQLAPIATDGAPDEPGATVLALGPLTFPEYLKRPQMVKRGSGTTISVDEFNRWAEPLDESMPRVLAGNVDGLMSDLVVVPFKNRAVEASYRLYGSVTQFDADESGRTVLIVQWGITRTEGGVTVAPRTDRYVAQATPADDPAAIAGAMSDLLGQFSREIVTLVRATILNTEQ